MVGRSVTPLSLKRLLQIHPGKIGQITNFLAIRASTVAVEPNEINASLVRINSLISDLCETNIIFLQYSGMQKL